MSCTFPGIWGMGGDENFYPCRCQDCSLIWPCPKDLKPGDYVDVVDYWDTWRGQFVKQVPGYRREYAMLVHVESDPSSTLTSDDIRKWSSRDILWRRVTIETRYDRDVL